MSGRVPCGGGGGEDSAICVLKCQVGHQEQ